MAGLRRWPACFALSRLRADDGAARGPGQGAGPGWRGVHPGALAGFISNLETHSPPSAFLPLLAFSSIHYSQSCLCFWFTSFPKTQTGTGLEVTAQEGES